jgi:serine/threonine protein kinase
MIKKMSLSTYNRRLEFRQEAERLAQLNDRNVARLLGASLGDDPMCIVLENSECGDLNQYLQSHVAETSTVQTAKTLRYVTTRLYPSHQFNPCQFFYPRLICLSALFAIVFNQIQSSFIPTFTISFLSIAFLLIIPSFLLIISIPSVLF